MTAGNATRPDRNGAGAAHTIPPAVTHLDDERMAAARFPVM